MKRSHLSNVAVVATFACVLTGCRGVAPREGDTSNSREVISRDRAPAYQVIAERYNTRVDRLECLRASVELKLVQPDEKGKIVEHEAEGNLQFVRPRRFALRINKAAQVLFWLGSNEREFWWIDRNAEPPTALVGTHSGAAARRVEEMGVPVRPADLAELLAVLPLPRERAGATVGWSPDGHDLLVDHVFGRTIRRLRLNPETLDPVRVELYTDERLAAYSVLSKIGEVDVRDDSRAHPTTPTRIEVHIPSTGTRLVLNLSNMENPGEAKMRTKVFDLESLKAAYGVERVILLDEARDGGTP
jgi:hypothetical protein